MKLDLESFILVSKKWMNFKAKIKLLNGQPINREKSLSIIKGDSMISSSKSQNTQNQRNYLFSNLVFIMQTFTTRLCQVHQPSICN
jgi:hypothetical protein